MQVLSNSVAKAMQLKKDDKLDETIKFITMFDKWFDCLNVSALSAGKLSRNSFKSAYCSEKDFRLKVSA